MNTNYPSIEDLKRKASKRVPKFAFEYLIGGANAELNLRKNSYDLGSIELMPEYLKSFNGADTSTEIFGRKYSLPVGIAPIGLQGLIWPKAPEILAKSAVDHNIPFVLSTVSTASIEQISEITNGDFWFQLYHPKEANLRDDLLRRYEDAGGKTLIILADTPSFGIRYKDVKNGLGMPPKMTLSNILSILSHPNWALRTLFNGQPGFASLEQYMPKGLNLKQLGQFMNDTFDGRLSEQKIKDLRKLWKGNLVIKGVVNERDAQRAVDLGADGIIVSNHGGRQIDAGESTINSMQRLIPKFQDQLTVMIDSGLRSGPDIARCIAAGAQFTFMGRPFMYGVGALGNQGGEQTVTVLKKQFTQVMQQLGCETVEELRSCLIA